MLNSSQKLRSGHLKLQWMIIPDILKEHVFMILFVFLCACVCGYFVDSQVYTFYARRAGSTWYTA